MSFASMMLVGLILDALLGWPDAVYRRIGHPVTWIGALITWLDTAWNAGDAAKRRTAGTAAALAVIVATALPILVVMFLLPNSRLGVILGGVIVWPMIAARSLYTHVAAVAEPLADGDMPASRHAVAQIVGRDPDQLDSAGIARASLESLAENTSDGVIAPLFWGVLLGPVGLWGYKAINTLDSMIGHRTPRHADFGRFAARLDDLVNLVPARLSGAIFAVTSGRPKQGWRIMARDARRHRSPNAGWPESALAAGLSVRLSGPRRYKEGVADEPWLNGEARDPAAQDIRRGLALYLRAMILTAALLLGLSIL